MSFAIGFLLFLVLFAIVLGAISVATRFVEVQRKKQVQTMLHATTGQVPVEDESSILLDPEARDRVQALMQRSPLFGRLQTLILQAGLTWPPGQVVAMMFVGAFVGGLLGNIFQPLGFQLLSMILFGALVSSAPLLILQSKRRRRMADFEEQLPEALDFLARSMKAGHAFSVSLEMLGNESPDPLGQEFRALFAEQNLGAPLEVALNSFSHRVPLLDVRLFVSGVLLQRRTGGNLSEILTRLAFLIRERFRLRGQVKAASAHGRMTSLVLTVLPIITIILLQVVAPGYLKGMADDPDGKWLILGSILGQIAGYFVMRKIIDIKV